jgi:hypothetical protein
MDPRGADGCAAAPLGIWMPCTPEDLKESPIIQKFRTWNDAMVNMKESE